MLYLIIIILICIILFLTIKYKNIYNIKQEDYKKTFNNIYNTKQNEIELLNKHISTLSNEILTLNQRIELDEQINKKSIDDFLETWKSRIDSEFNNYIKISENTIKDTENKVNKINYELEDYKKKRHAINEAIKRENELREKEQFYKIFINESDIKDIDILQTITTKLNNKEILYKLIYTTYIQKPAKDMINRVCGTNKISGIYKLTYKNGECYIGKSTDIANRWIEHIKSSLSIGTIAHSKFHTRLSQDGVWNYTWEILEEVSKEQLTEREKYWITFYESNIYGLNEKVG